MSNESDPLTERQLNPTKPENAVETAQPKQNSSSIPNVLPITEQAENDKPPKNRKIFRRLLGVLRRSRRLRIVLVGLLVIAAAVCFNLFDGKILSDRVWRMVRYASNATEFSFDSHSSNDYLSFRRGLAIASVSGLLYLDENGKEADLIQNHTDFPALLCNDTVALSYGIGANTITAFHHKKGTVLDLTVPGTLLDAYLSPDSCVCYASVQSGYKTVLTVLDKNGEEIYSWYSSTQFFSQCAVSKKAHTMAAIALGQNGSGFETTCVLFATDQEKPVAQVSLGNDLIYDLRFVSPRRLCAVGESALHYFDLDGTNYAKYPFTGGELMLFDAKADSFTAIVRNMNEAGSRFRITTINDRGKQLAELSLDDAIVDINTNGRYLAVLTADSLRVYDRHLHLCLSEDNVGFANRVCVQRDGSALLIDSSSARRIS